MGMEAGEVGCCVGRGTGTSDPDEQSPKKLHAVRHGLCTFRRRVLGVIEALRGLGADAAFAVA